MHPLAPPGTKLNAGCRYDEFSGWVRSGATIQVEATGVCVVLRTDGTVETILATNRLWFLEAPSLVFGFV